MAVTQEQIDEAIKNCYWRKDFGGADVCKGELAPCMRVIEKGNCDTLKKLFTEIEDIIEDSIIEEEGRLEEEYKGEREGGR